MNFIKDLIKYPFLNYIKDLEINILLNAILVNENVRPAMLVQPIDYNEKKGTDKKTLTIVNGIKKIFPDLYLTDNYEIYQGTIISKKKIPLEKGFISLEDMGNILGYPCYKDFEDANRDDILYEIALIASYNNNSEIQLFVNVCKDKKTLKNFDLIAKKAFEVLTSRKYNNLLKGININRVYVNVENIIPTQFVINKLITNKKVTQEEKDKISEILYNCGFSDDLSYYDFQYNNKIHKGILLDILIRERFDTLCPLQKYSSQESEVDRITNKFEKGLIDVLNKTRKK